MQGVAAIFWGISLVLTILTMPVLLWQAAVGVFGLLPDRRKIPAAKRTEKPHRFAVVVCARNEQAVIGKLLDSLYAQDYPRDLFTLYVAADNCTDGTAAEARRHHACVYERFDREHVGKGFALRWLLERIREEHPEEYDAVAVFDADNLATPGFLRRMNDALCAGADVAKGSRHASNPGDSWVSGSYAIYWRSMMYFFHRARANRGLSCFVDGTGFAFKASLLRGEGWSTRSMVEDCEFSMQQICRGRVIVPVSDAVYYDEQPDSFAVSLRQRFRWTVGCVQCVKYCLPDALRALRGGRGTDGSSRFAALDVIAYLLLIPAVGIGLIATVFGVLALLFSPPSQLVLHTAALAMPFLSWAGLSAGAMLTLLVDRQPLRPLLGAVFLFPLFVFSMSGMALVALFRPKTTWKPIVHSSRTRLGDLPQTGATPPGK